MRVLAFQSNSQIITQKNEQYKLVNKIYYILQNENVDLIVLPELSFIQYNEAIFKNLENLNLVEKNIKGDIFKKLSYIAKKTDTFIAYGSVTCDNKNNKYISHIVIDKNGNLLADYNKQHIAQFGDSVEKKYFKSGDKICAFEIGGFKIGVIICYDIRFNEFISNIVDEYNLDFIVHPVAWSKDFSFWSWHNFVITRAIENQVYFLSLNRSGSNFGKSIFIKAFAYEKELPVIFGKNEEYKIFELNKNDLKSMRSFIPIKKDKIIKNGS